MYLKEELYEEQLVKQDNIDTSLFDEGVTKTYLQNLYIKKEGVVYRIEKVPRKTGYVKINQKMNLDDYVLVCRNIYALRRVKKDDIYEELNPITLTAVYKKFVTKDKIYYQELGCENGMIWSESINNLI